jgi:hypothetical protein
MKSSPALEPKPVRGASCAMPPRRLRSCQKILAQIGNVKNVLLTEWHNGFEGNERMLKLALNEAEALAWQTSYPHLVFPALAAEKIQGVRDWVQRQRGVRHPAGVEYWPPQPATLLAA